MTKKSFAHELPETLLIIPAGRTGHPIDAITAACTRAEAVLDMLMLHFRLPAEAERLSETQVSNVLWDVQGTLGLIRTLALHKSAA